MAEEDSEQSQERTEEPSAKRLKESRDKGQIARSKDFNATVILMFSGAAFLIFGGSLSNQLLQMMRHAFEFNTDVLVTSSAVMYKLFDLGISGFWSCFPLLIVILILSIVAPLLTGGWVFSSQSIQPKFSRLSLMKGLKRMVSLKSFVEMIKSFAKFALVASVSLFILWWKIPRLIVLADYPIESAIINGIDIIAWCFILISASLILIAAIDVPFQIHEHKKQLKMTKQEVRDEYKETEGKPEVKAQIRRTQHEMARRRMMSEVPKANVVVTNPTHYAVAIRYEEKGKKAPVIVAKGRDLVALQINRIAQAHNVPIISVPPLARAIYYSTKLNAEIPRGLYIAVAQVLAYIFQLKNKHTYEHQPEFLQNVPIPDDLKRDAEESS
ncbi:flagellar biosynthesis protein FlhB [Legionella dresdenensis]|uniref:Flagellar biosynthetic protein FlhB n=1 Tax=Legionella dresdenensis TaxID=450200 RepID=A0ABV8CCE5_9GAMM